MLFRKKQINKYIFLFEVNYKNYNENCNSYVQCDISSNLTCNLQTRLCSCLNSNYRYSQSKGCGKWKVFDLFTCEII